MASYAVMRMPDYVGPSDDDETVDVLFMDDMRDPDLDCEDDDEE